jgi:hypothetical protein
MALLDQSFLQRRGNVAAAGIALGAAAVLLGGCFAFHGEESGPPRLAFSHRVHVDEGLDCGNCHIGAEDSDEPGMPSLRGCMLCHSDIDAEKAPERRAAALFDENGVRGPRTAALGDEVIFSHLGHVEAGLDCAACHGDLAGRDDLGSDAAVPMAECVACHQRADAPADRCATCHSEIDADWAPPSHAVAWTRLHGGVAQAELGGPRNDCALCHTESACTSCHREQPPENHTNYWRSRGHTFTASMDRASCSTCHQSDFCNRCHAVTEPLSHRGAFGGTLSTHCLGCHFPLSAEEGCGVCHKGTPSHLLASPKPPDHVPGMNCLQCHGVQQPLPHVDKGDDCNACHK